MREDELADLKKAAAYVKSRRIDYGSEGVDSPDKALAMIEEKYDPKREPLFKLLSDEGGVQIYLIDESRGVEAAMKAVRAAIDEYYGQQWNPWCIIRRSSDPSEEDDFEEDVATMYEPESEGMSEDAASFWKIYSLMPKRIAFKGSKPLAVSAISESCARTVSVSLSDLKRKTGIWWDLHNQPSIDLPVNGAHDDYSFVVQNLFRSRRLTQKERTCLCANFFRMPDLPMEYKRAIIEQSPENVSFMLRFCDKFEDPKAEVKAFEMSLKAASSSIKRGKSMEILVDDAKTRLARLVEDDVGSKTVATAIMKDASHPAAAKVVSVDPAFDEIAKAIAGKPCLSWAVAIVDDLSALPEKTSEKTSAIREAIYEKTCARAAGEQMSADAEVCSGVSFAELFAGCAKRSWLWMMKKLLHRAMLSSREDVSAVEALLKRVGYCFNVGMWDCLREAAAEAGVDDFRLLRSSRVEDERRRAADEDHQRALRLEEVLEDELQHIRQPRR